MPSFVVDAIGDRISGAHDPVTLRVSAKDLTRYESQRKIISCDSACEGLKQTPGISKRCRSRAAGQGP